MNNLSQPIDQEGLIVDETTGEVLGIENVAQPQSQQEARNLLTHLARRAKQNLDEAEGLAAQLKAEIDSITHAYTVEIKKLENRVERIKNYALIVAFRSNLDSVHCPGYGHWGNYKKGGNAVDDNDWRKFEESSKREYPEEYPNLFRTEIVPDKIAIKSALKTGVVINGFRLSEETTEWEFRKER